MQAADNLKKPVRLGALSMAKVIGALLERPCNVPDLMHLSGLSTNTVHEYMRALRKEGVVHIGAWKRDATGRESLRVFKLGSGKDVARARKSKAQIARECRQRKQLAKQKVETGYTTEPTTPFFWPKTDEPQPTLANQGTPSINEKHYSHRLR